MPHISRIFLSHVGANVAYFPPQVQEILPDARPDLPPFTSLLLPNGGGKTSMISLVLAIFEPNQDRFLAKLRKDQAAERTFDSYLSEKGDASFVACEMIVPVAPMLEKRLVCGYCAANAQAQSSVWRNFFVFETEDRSLDLMALMPGAGGTEAEIRRVSDFHLWCERMSARDVNFQVVVRQKDWRPLLAQRKVDVDMMRLLVSANMTESDPTVGILTSRKEIDFLASVLGKVMSGEELESKHQTFLEASIKIQDRNGKAQLLERHRELSERVAGFAHEADQTKAARTRFEQERARVRDLVDSVEATFRVLEAEVAVLDAAMQEERAHVAETTRLQGAAEAAKEACEHQVLSLEMAEAGARHASLASDLSAVRRERASIDLAALYATIAAARTELAAVEETLKRKRASVAPFEDAAAKATRVLRKSLRSALDSATGRARTAEEAIARHEAGRSALRRARDDAAGSARSLDREEARIDGDLRSAANERNKAEAKGLVQVDEPTETAQRRTTEAAARVDARLRDIAAEIAAARDGIARVQRERDAMESDRRRLSDRRAKLTGRIDEADLLQSDIDRDALSRRLLESDAIDPNSDDALGQLERLVHARRAAHVAREQEIAAHGRAIDSIDRWDVAVTNPEVEVALRDLEAAGLESARPYGRWIADSVDPEGSLALASSDPGRLAGIHVPDVASLDLAAGILRRREDAGLLSPIVISIDAAGVTPPAVGRAVVLPDTAAAWSREEAALLRTRQAADKQAREDESARLAREADQIADTCAKIRGWRSRFGGGIHAEIVAELGGVVDRLGEAESSVQAAEERLADNRGRIDRLQAEESQLAMERARLVSAAADIAALLNVERAAVPLRDRLIEVRARRDEARASEERAASAEEALSEATGQERVRLSLSNEEASAYRAEIAALGEGPEPDASTPLVDVGSARGAYATASENLRRSSEAAFGKNQFLRDALVERISRAEGDASRLRDKPGIDDGLARGHAASGADLEALKGDLDRAAADLERAHGGASQDLGVAKARLARFDKDGRKQPPVEPRPVSGIDEANANLAACRIELSRATEALSRLAAANQQRSQDLDRTNRHLTSIRDLRETMASDVGVHGAVPVAGRGVAQAPAEIDGLKSAYAGAKKGLNEVRAQAERLDKGCRDAFEDVRRYASNEQFQRLEPTMSVHIMTADYDAAFENSADLSRITLDRIACVEDELRGLDRSVETAVDIMAPFVSDALRVLRMATEFRIPDTSPVLPGMEVMQCRKGIFAVTEAARRADITNQLREMAHNRSVPQDGPALLAALCDSIAGGNLGIRILKINTIDNGEHQPYTAMMHSGGQYMAASMMMFALIANLRARTAGNYLASRTATLIMDNPFGKLSYDEFWRTVLSVMKVLGVQVIAYTGKADNVTTLLPGMLAFQRRRNRDGSLVTVTAESLVWEQRAA